MNLRRTEDGEYALQRKRKWQPGYYVRWQDEGGKHIAWVGATLEEVVERLGAMYDEWEDGRLKDKPGIRAWVIASKYAAKYSDHQLEEKLPWE